MNTKQVWFLYKQGLINPQLIRNFELKHGNFERVSEQLKYRISTLMLLDILTLIIVVFGLSIWNIVDNFAQVGIVFLIVLYVGSKHFLNTFHPIVNSLSKLNHFLYTDRDDVFRKYHLHMEYDWLIERAKKILSRSASLLIESELSHGVDAELTLRARKIFKEAHAIFVKFDLCEENQGFYIREAQDFIHDCSKLEPESVKK